MPVKDSFSESEWSLVLAAPLLSGLAVTLAEPSGLFGMLQEGMASGKALLEARSDPAAGELIRAVVAAMETSEGRTAARETLQSVLSGEGKAASVGEAAPVKQRAIAALAEIAGLVDAKAPQDAPAFKAWLKHVAETVAESASEGGFLGFGGVKVTEAERATIVELAAALKLPA